MTLFIQASARQDILDQVDWYGGQGLLDIARRFHWAVVNAIDALVAMPSAAPPKRTSNPLLAGLRAWPVKGFDQWQVYYLVRPSLLTVLRVLHDKRDINAILRVQDLEEP